VRPTHRRKDQTDHKENVCCRDRGRGKGLHAGGIGGQGTLSLLVVEREEGDQKRGVQRVPRARSIRNQFPRGLSKRTTGTAPRNEKKGIVEGTLEGRKGCPSWNIYLDFGSRRWHEHK